MRLKPISALSPHLRCAPPAASGGRFAGGRHAGRIPCYTLSPASG